MAQIMDFLLDLPYGKPLHNYGNSPFLIGPR